MYFQLAFKLFRILEKLKDPNVPDPELSLRSFSMKFFILLSSPIKKKKYQYSSQNGFNNTLFQPVGLLLGLPQAPAVAASSGSPGTPHVPHGPLRAHRELRVHSKSPRTLRGGRIKSDSLSSTFETCNNSR